MAEVLCIDYPEMEQVAKKFQQQQQQVAQMTRRLTSAVQSLHQEGWIGLGSDAFFNEMFEKVLPALKRLEESLGEGCSASTQIAQKLAEAEEGGAKLFQWEA